MIKKTIRSYDLLPEIERKLLQDLVTNCENITRVNPNNNNPPHFPPFPEENHDDEVIVRNHSRSRNDRPKTIASSTTKPKEPPLKLNGIKYIEIANEQCFKLRQDDIIRIQDSCLQLLDEKGAVKENIRYNLALKTKPKLIGKKEIEFTDTKETSYRLLCGSNKDARHVLEALQTYYVIPVKKPLWQLIKLLKKRSTRDLLESKGIYRNEPIFGNTLEQLWRNSGNPVPEVVTKLTQMIEQEVNIKSLGIYRTNANLATLQHIRCEINAGRWEILKRYHNDVDVLAGTLKLFFRELMEPLIPIQVCQLLRQATVEEFGDILGELPECNLATLAHIMAHILKVCQYKNDNKMDFRNMAICWGPSLMAFPENLDLVLQTTEFTRNTERLIEFYDNNREMPKQHDYVYDVVRKLTRIVDARIETEGIYRKSGSNSKIERIVHLLETFNLEEINESSKFDIHDICCALKKFLANQRQAIISDDFFYHYYQICDKLETEALRKEVIRMVDELPRKDTIYLLFQHLKRVVTNEIRNKMTFNILSQIWITTLTSGSNIQNYKIKMPKYEKLIAILLHLNEVEQNRKNFVSQYDNVPDDDDN